MARRSINIEHDNGTTGKPMSPLKIDPTYPRGTRVQFTDESKCQRLQGQVAYIAQYNDLGMFWVFSPEMAEADPAYARHLFGPFMECDIGKPHIMRLAPSRQRGPDLDKILAPRFKRGRR